MEVTDVKINEILAALEFNDGVYFLRLSQTSKLLFLQNLRAIKNPKNLSAMILAGVAAARNINIVI